jgi:hypothetical protein|tara:strand:+ start:273 stop:452 length:180 start_codon:yes stop_codon:yes gene_type:complete
MNNPWELIFKGRGLTHSCSTEAEIKIMKDLVINVASEVQKQQKLKIEFMVGTMIKTWNL